MSFLKSGWVLFGVIALSFAAMIVLMMKSTGDFPYRATAAASIHSEPDINASVIGSLEAGSVLMCHTPRDGHPDWLDCSDMIEQKFVRLEIMEAISEAEYDEARKASRPQG